MRSDNGANTDIMDDRLAMLIRQFECAIAEGKPFSDVKTIYLEIKELKVQAAGKYNLRVNSNRETADGRENF
jgi:hypothetical protein